MSRASVLKNVLSLQILAKRDITKAQRKSSQWLLCCQSNWITDKKWHNFKSQGSVMSEVELGDVLQRGDNFDCCLVCLASVELNFLSDTVSTQKVCRVKGGNWVPCQRWKLGNVDRTLIFSSIYTMSRIPDNMTGKLFLVLFCFVLFFWILCFLQDPFCLF